MIRKNLKCKEKIWTKDEKINWVFKYLVRILQPEVINSHLFTDRFFAKYNGVKKPVTLTYLCCKCKIENMPEEISFPFKGVSVFVDKNLIKIIGDDFYYKFPPQVLFTLWERFNPEI